MKHNMHLITFQHVFFFFAEYALCAAGAAGLRRGSGVRARAASSLPLKRRRFSPKGEADTCNMWLLHNVTETVVSREVSLSEMVM